ncbi:cell adhesion molecule Dscam2-like isoform X2 [Daktulosphaira vitifoliae]|uniref:cell adhesion molecule Dscam2-like isoform X2 n=1 Tax=Daktulosphaira vitifoliae TaxID=58002 RepID=UPI0021AA1304|nr:cell adhesion molecule Dscam2-like isoform X2 [Daktulosphaira vitifoliae]
MARLFDMNLRWMNFLLFGLYYVPEIMSSSWQMSSMEAPSFSIEPPNSVYFSNTTGTLLNCQGHGYPQPNITWLMYNDKVVIEVPRLREIQPSGSLYFPPFPSQDYTPDIHTTIYKCALENPIGKIISRESQIKAVIVKTLGLVVENAVVFQGNVAMFKCQSPELISEHVVKTWFKTDDSKSGIEQAIPIYLGGRYVIALDGTLLVHNVVLEDRLDRYFCQVKNKYTGDQLTSQFAKIIVKQSIEEIRPTIKYHTNHLNVKTNQPIDILCLAEGYPPPSYKWFKVDHGSTQEVSIESLSVHPYQSLLRITSIPITGSRIIYKCEVSNKIGQDQREIIIAADTPFAVSIHPLKQVIDSGSTAIFNCSAQGTFLKPLYSWLKNGAPIIGFERYEISQEGNQLIIQNVMKNDDGIYQCLIRNPDTDDTAQASALLLLGAVSPELFNVFPEQIIQNNGFLSLRCIASGNPPPRIYWYLDGGLLLPQGDYVFGSYMHIDGNIVSYLNVSVADVLHGGYYSCLARNILGFRLYSAMVKIYGDPVARPPLNLTVRSDDDAYLQCPVAGYPIARTVWKKDMVSISNHSRHQLFDNGTLFIRSTQDISDSGLYVCTKINDKGQFATGNLYLKIMKPPVVTPFQFTKDLQQSERAQVSCTIKSGDLPMEFVWRKDNRILTTDNEIELQNFKFSSTIFFSNLKPHHAGLYTCIVSNFVASSNYSALLNIKAPPRWIVEPEDTSVLVNQPTVINCQAEGYPQPKIIWTKASNNHLLQSFNIFSDYDLTVLGNGSLTIQLTTRQYEDNYTCSAENGIGKLISKTVSLKVHIPAQFKEKIINKNGVGGSKVLLTCKAEGSKPLSIQWKPFVNNIKTKDTKDGVISEMLLESLNRNQTGVYICMASNSYGYDRMTINLVVKEPPVAPKQLKVVEAGTRWLEFSWEPVEIFITHYILQLCHNLCINWSNYTINGSLTHTKVSYLKPATIYIVQVVSVNDFGCSNPSQNVTVTTLGDKPSAPPDNLEAINIESNLVAVKWNPPEKNTWNGQILGYKLAYIDTNELSVINIKTIFGVSRCYFNITNLSPFTTYQITVRSFNELGFGPDSDFIRVVTKEGVPSEPPQNVKCLPLTTESLRMSWNPPPMVSHHGIILGYKIQYKKINQILGTYVANEMKRTTNLETNLHGLEKYTNYSIKVLAYTKVGDGVQSNTIYCVTEQDAPGSPENVKALTVTSNSVLVSWTPPIKSNGIIIKYVVHVKHNKVIEKEIVFGEKNTKIEVRHLKEFQRYEFWVTASTTAGEGQPSFRVIQSPNSRAPARVASFGDHINVVVGTKCLIECYTVGMPTPIVKWKQPEGTEVEVLTDGSLMIGPINDSSYEGNYTCHVENIFGRDQVSYMVHVLYPPEPPEFYVESISTEVILVQWRPIKQFDIVTTAYTLNYKLNDNPPEKVDIDSDNLTYYIRRLKCGSKYSVSMQTVNTVGISRFSQVKEVLTKGGVPDIPDKDTVLAINSTSLTFTFSTWPINLCSIHSFTCHYTLINEENAGIWIKMSKQKLTSDTFTISHLKPATVYTVRMIVHTEAGDRTWEHTLATRTLSGDIVQIQSNNKYDIIQSIAQLHKYVPVASALICLVSFCVCICVVIKRRKKESQYLRGSPIERESSVELEKQIEFTSFTMRNRGSSLNKSDEKTIEYEVSPYATFNVIQTTAPSISKTSSCHRTLSQSDCYEMPDQMNTYEVSYISNKQTFPVSTKLCRRTMSPVHFIEDLNNASYHNKMTSIRKQGLDI